jgi:hypothetical protein
MRAVALLLATALIAVPPPTPPRIRRLRLLLLTSLTRVCARPATSPPKLPSPENAFTQRFDFPPAAASASWCTPHPADDDGDEDSAAALVSLRRRCVIALGRSLAFTGEVCNGACRGFGQQLPPTDKFNLFLFSDFWTGSTLLVSFPRHRASYSILSYQ